MTTREKIIVGVMCLTILYGIYEVAGNRGTRKPAPPPQRGTIEELRKFAAEMTQKMLKDSMAGEYQYMIRQAAADWTKDPFIQSIIPLKREAPAAAHHRVPDVALQPASQFAFTGFLQLGQTRLAVINGMEYAVGEAVDTQGHYILSISANRVVIGNVKGSETIKLPLIEME